MLTFVLIIADRTVDYRRPKMCNLSEVQLLMRTAIVVSGEFGHSVCFSHLFLRHLWSEHLHIRRLSAPPAPAQQAAGQQREQGHPNGRGADCDAGDRASGQPAAACGQNKQ